MEPSNTIRDVARLAGVSVSTVSRVLNDPGTVKREKRERVHAAIASLDFRPNRTAQGLKSKSFKTIALIVTDISNLFFAQIARSIEGYCDEAGYTVLLCNIANSEEKLARFLKDIPQRGVDGVIISSGAFLEGPLILPLLQDLVRNGPPLVLSGHAVRGLAVATVVNDNESAEAQVIEHLWRSGRRRVAYLGGPAHSAIYSERREIFSRLARERGLELDPGLIRESDFEFESGRRAAKSIIARHPDVDAIVCGGDQLAIGAMRGLKDLGRRIPDDVAVIGFDDTPLAQFSEPTLTSVSVNVDRIGALAASKMIDLINGELDEVVTQVDCDLIIRESS